MTSPLYVEPSDQLGQEPPRELVERIQRLEDDVAELRVTMTRFADLMVGEVKELRKSQTAESPPPPPPEGAIVATDLLGDSTASETPPQPAASAAPAGSTPPPARRRWLLTELLGDFRIIFRMYLDPRYRVRRATQLMVPVIVGLFILNWFFFSSIPIPFVSSAIEKVIDVVLAILAYKVLIRETDRYRTTIAQLLIWQQHRAHTPAVVIGSEPPMTQLETE
jgi:hypothetical protein